MTCAPCTHLLWLCSLLLVWLSPAVNAETQTTEIYETYIAAQKLIPVLQPLIGPEDKITAYRNKLFVKASPSVQNEILGVLMEVDRPLKNIQISLRYGRSDTLEQQQNQTQSEVKVFRGSSNSKQIDVEVINRNTLLTNNDSADQSIRVLEGEQGVLEVGKDYPSHQLMYSTPFYSGVDKEYRAVGDQIWVTPMLVQDQVRIEISTSNKRRKNNNRDEIEKVEAKSVIVVTPGEWVPLATSNQLINQSNSQKSLSTRSLKSSDASLQIRALILD